MSTLGRSTRCVTTDPLALMHDLVATTSIRLDAPLLPHDNWVAIAARHLFDELLLSSNAVEFAIAAHFVFETGVTQTFSSWRCRRSPEESATGCSRRCEQHPERRSSHAQSETRPLDGAEATTAPTAVPARQMVLAQRSLGS